MAQSLAAHLHELGGNAAPQVGPGVGGKRRIRTAAIVKASQLVKDFFRVPKCAPGSFTRPKRVLPGGRSFQEAALRNKQSTECPPRRGSGPNRACRSVRLPVCPDCWKGCDRNDPDSFPILELDFVRRLCEFLRRRASLSAGSSAWPDEAKARTRAITAKQKKVCVPPQVNTLVRTSPLPLYSGGEGRGEGRYNCLRKLEVFAEILSPLYPRPSPEYGGEGRKRGPD